MRLGFGAWGLGGSVLNTGVGEYSRQLLTHLPELDPDLELFAYTGPDDPRPEWLPEVVAWRPLAAPLPRRYRAMYAHLVSLPILARQDRLDVFHMPAIHVRPSFPCVPRLRCPVVVTVHDLIPIAYYGAQLPQRLRRFYRWNLDRALGAQMMIAVSEHARNELLHDAPAAAERIHVVLNAVDFAPNPALQPLDRMGVRRPYILYAGSYEPRKNLHGALAAYARLLQLGVQVEFVALVERESGYRAEVLQAAARLGVADRVRWLHSLTDPDVRALYTHAQTLFFPSLAEGFGYPPVQAAACGVPVVASDIPVLHEVLDRAAYFVDPLNVEEMAAGLQRVLADADLRNRMATDGRARAAGFKLTGLLQGHHDVYRAAAGSRLAVAC